MNIKKISLLILLVFILMGISFATETNNDSENTDTTPIVKDTNSNEYKNIIKKHDEKNFKKASNNQANIKSYNVTTFKTLQSALTSNKYNEIKINIKSNLKLANKTEINENIRKVEIEGNGKLVNGNNKYSFLNIPKNCTITIKNINITNCNNTDASGIIENNGKLTIKNTTITNNTALIGGAIINREKLTITKSIINHNKAQYEGGAIYNYGNLTITKSTLNNNSATINYYTLYETEGGGAISNSGRLIIKDCVLNNNKINGIAGYGGAINNYCGDVNITNTLFNNNRAENDGGAITNFEGILSIKNSTFKNNKANVGGAIDNEWGDLNITDSTIINSRANQGGALYNIYYSEKIIITNTTINNNKAREGGAICNKHSDLYGEDFYEYMGKILIQNSTLKNNNASELGGAIYNSGQIKIKEAILNNNTATNNSHDLFNNGKLIIMNLTLQNNTKKTINNRNMILIPKKHKILNKIDNKGNIIHISKLNKNEKNFTYLSNLINSGKSQIKLKYDIKLDIYNDEDNTFKTGIKIYDQNFKLNGNNHKINSQGSRAFYLFDTNVDICNLTFMNGFEYSGPSICNWGNLTVRNTTFKNNNADTYGAIYNDKNLTVIACKFFNNKAWFGGAIYNTNKLIITKSILNNNRAGSGGAIGNDNARIYNITGNTFKNNRANGPGGAIYNDAYVSKAGLKIIQNNFLVNNTGGKKSSIYTSKYEKNNVSNNFFDDEIKNTKIIINKIGDIKYGNNVTIQGKFLSVNGKILKNSFLNIKVNNKNIKVKTNNNGIFTYKIQVTKIGSNTLTITFQGNQNYNAKTVKTTFKVVKQNLKITINKVNNIKRGRTVTISGKFMDANGKILMNSNLKVKLNRKTVTVRTNKMGVYTYKAKVSSIGTNYITVSHDGNINYNKKSVQTTFKVTR